MSGFKPFAMRATNFSLYASIQIKIYASHLSLLQSLTYSQEKNIKNRHEWHYTAPTGLNNLG